MLSKKNAKDSESVRRSGASWEEETSSHLYENSPTQGSPHQPRSSLSCYNCPTRCLEGDKGERRPSGNSNWLISSGYYVEMMIVVLSTFLTFQEHKRNFCQICHP